MTMKNFLKFKKQQAIERRDFNEDAYIRESTTWRPLRYLGVFAALLAQGSTLYGAINDKWIDGMDYTLGLWQNCYTNLSILTNENFTIWCETSDSFKPYWQAAVIGLLIFAVSFGLLGLILSVCGVCSSKLPKKLYYYHSAGEIYYVCALTTAMALILFPSAIKMGKNVPDDGYSFSYGYFIGWGSSILFVVAALGMTLDDITRTCATCCAKGCCGRNAKRDSNRAQNV